MTRFPSYRCADDCIRNINSLFDTCFANRSSYPDRKEGEDADMDDEALTHEENLEYGDEMLELTLPSGDLKFILNLQISRVEHV